MEELYAKNDNLEASSASGPGLNDEVVDLKSEQAVIMIKVPKSIEEGECILPVVGIERICGQRVDFGHLKMPSSSLTVFFQMGESHSSSFVFRPHSNLSLTNRM